jgi:hypothetical protein
MYTMHTIGRLAIAAAFVVAMMLPAVAQEKASEKPGMVVADLVVLTATVEAKVDEQVKKFAQVKAGDEVVLRHTEAVAIAVGKP